MHTLSRSLMTGLLITALIACSSSDDDDDDGGSTTPPLEPLVINEDNAQEVASAVLLPLILLNTLNIGDDLLPIGLDNSAFAVANDIAAQRIDIELPSQACDVSGTVTLAVNIADDDLEMLTSGDTLSFDFNQCDNGEDIVIDGLLELEVLEDIAFNLDLEFEPPYALNVLLTFTRLSLSEPEQSAVLEGSLELLEQTDDGVEFNTRLDSEQVSLELNGSRELLRDVLIVGTANSADLSYTLDACEGEICTRLESDSLGGIVEFGNLSRFSGSGDESPSSGLMAVLGGIASGASEQSRLFIEALDASCVELRGDNDGDGNIDWTERTTWDSLSEDMIDPC